MNAPRVLLLVGGWEGHEPFEVARAARRRLLADCDVTQTSDLGCLEPAFLRRFDLFIPIWTFGELPDGAEEGLLDAVRDGLGIVAWHGFTSAFLRSRPLKHMIGGQFVAHPGGDSTTYTVDFSAGHPLTRGLAPLTVTSEQYYLLVDPAVQVVATTVMEGGPMPWLAGVRMPVAWTRSWGAGRVFFCSLGHTASMLDLPQFASLLSRAVTWAVRKPARVVEPKPGAEHGVRPGAPR